MPSELSNTLLTLMFLFEVRLAADYDLRAGFDRAGALRAVDRADKLFRDWQAVRTTAAARAFLMMVLGPRGFTR